MIESSHLSKMYRRGVYALHDLSLNIGKGEFLFLTGPSGSGKSSVVMAGLLPRLERGALPGSERWVYLEPVVPGAHPLEALALTLALRLSGRSVKSIREDLEDESARGLHLLATRRVRAPGQQVVVMLESKRSGTVLTSRELGRPGSGATRRVHTGSRGRRGRGGRRRGRRGRRRASA